MIYLYLFKQPTQTMIVSIKVNIHVPSRHKNEKFLPYIQYADKPTYFYT